jgi:predicted dienelactone hydrolase
VIFAHGTAGFRTQSLTFMTHWASRGFVVVAADHPSIHLASILGDRPAQSGTQSEDVGKILDGVAEIFPGKLDAARVAMSGHSAGTGAIAGYSDRVRLMMPMAGRGTNEGDALESSLILGAKDDGVALYSRTQDAYEASPKKKRLVGLANAGHLAFSDLCQVGRDKGGLLQIALNHGVSVPGIVARLARDGCGDAQLPPAEGWRIVNHATAAALEETLACGRADMTALEAMPGVAELREEL